MGVRVSTFLHMNLEITDIYNIALCKIPFFFFKQMVWLCANKTLWTLQFEFHVIFACHEIFSDFLKNYYKM